MRYARRHDNGLLKAAGVCLFMALMVCWLIFITGCTTGGARNVKWWSPATWFSAREAQAEDRAVVKLDDAKERAVKAAQGTAHETQVALVSAPESRPVDVARESNDQTVTLLDQAAGPLPSSEITKIRKQVTGLLSDNAALRTEAEKARAESRTTISDISAKLEKASSDLGKAQRDLRDAFDRENALANELRNERVIKWAVATLAVVGTAAWIYIKVTVGGMPQAVGLALRDLRAKNPDLAKSVAPFYTKYLSRREQDRIKQHAD